MKAAYVSAMRLARKAADASGLLAKLEKSESRKALWVRSLFGIYDSADLVQLDVPWWSFPAIDYVEGFLKGRQGQARIYEYGAGASTVWLAKRSRIVNSVEHDEPFAAAMKGIFDQYPTITVRVVEPTVALASSKARSKRNGYTDNAFDDYVASIESVGSEFDVIVIDGRSRVACLERAVSRLASDGIIVFDNSDRREYRSGIERSGLRETIYRGLSPALPFSSQTSILTPGD